jgi:hypothetical protein
MSCRISRQFFRRVFKRAFPHRHTLNVNQISRTKFISKYNLKPVIFHASSVLRYVAFKSRAQHVFGAGTLLCAVAFCYNRPNNSKWKYKIFWYPTFLLWKKNIFMHLTENDDIDCLCYITWYWGPKPSGYSDSWSAKVHEVVKVIHCLVISRYHQFSYCVIAFFISIIVLVKVVWVWAFTIITWFLLIISVSR